MATTDFQPSEQAAKLVLVEGIIQNCHGHLLKRSKPLRLWKKAYIEVISGPRTSTLRKHRRSTFLSFPTAPPGIRALPLCEFAESPDFTAFRVTERVGNAEREVCRFRATDMVQMRKFMASLGAVGSGLFSTQIHELAIANSGPVPSDASFYVYALPATEFIYSYGDAISRLPREFYLDNVVTSLDAPNTPSLPGQVVAFYDSSSPHCALERRAGHDTFRPPHGKPVLYLHSIGYGQEVGLPVAVQEVYNPCTMKTFFLDHNQQAILWEDPRPHTPERGAPSEPEVIEFGQWVDHSVPPHILTELSVVQEAAERARSKTAKYILQASGQNGLEGSMGPPGYPGAEGGRAGRGGITGDFSYHHGGSGFRGLDGGHGYIGGPGGDGGNGSDVNIALSGTAENFHVTSSLKEFTVNLEEGGVLLVDCRGGKGGTGGKGSVGGSGGNGGAGGDGAGPALGGAGGDGGHGGNGGKGGDGGNGGRGGNCLIQTSDPKLLMLVEVNCSGGSPGDGGWGGQGGKGGRGGPEGLGFDYSGRHYLHGRPGQIGCNGSRGRTGETGIPGTHGGLLWVVFSPVDNRILEESHTRYDAEVLGYKVSPALEGGVFEPNGEVVVSEVVVHNCGGLTLPHGTSVCMPSTTTVKFGSQCYEVPESGVKPGEDFKIPFEFRGQICDRPPPNKPGRQTFEAEVETRVKVLGRSFGPGSTVSRKITVQYPVQLNLVGPERMNRNEVSSIAMEVSNITDHTYGSCRSSSGKIALQVHLDARFLPLGAGMNPDSSAPFVITYDPNIRDSMFVEVFEIPPQQTVTVRVMVQLESQAELFEDCHWQADLYLRGKLVEYNFQQIRVVPEYVQQDTPADILFVTSDAISTREARLWEHIFHLLSVSVDYWDISKNRGFSTDSATGERHINSWVCCYSGKLILYPHCDTGLMRGEDVALHFHGENYNERPLKELGSSMVLFMPPSVPSHQHNRVVTRMLTQGCMPITSSLHPNDTSVRNFLTWLEKRNPAQSAIYYAKNTDSGFSQHNSNNADVREVPILRSSKLQVIDGSVTQMGLDDANFSPNTADIPLASNFGQAFLATLYGLPIQAKLKLLRTPESHSCLATFHLPNQLVMSREELVMVTLAREVAEEVFSCSGEALCMREIYTDVKTNTEAYSDSSQVVLRGLNLIREETKKCLAQLKNRESLKAHDEIMSLLVEMNSLLVGTDMDCADMRMLASLDLLQDQQSMKTPHQCFVKDEMWNLA